MKSDKVASFTTNGKNCLNGDCNKGGKVNGTDHIFSCFSLDISPVQKKLGDQKLNIKTQTSTLLLPQLSIRHMMTDKVLNSDVKLQQSPYY